MAINPNNGEINRVFRYFRDQRSANALISSGRVKLKPASTILRYEHCNLISSCGSSAEHISRGASYLNDEPRRTTMVHLSSEDRSRKDQGHLAAARSDLSQDDNFVFCASYLFSPCIADLLQANVCVRINDPWQFWFIIAEKLLDSRWSDGRGWVRHVEYGAAKAYSEALDAALIKPIAFSRQHEFRMVWTRKPSRDVDAIVLELPELAQLCEIVPIDKSNSVRAGVAPVKPDGGRVGAP